MAYASLREKGFEILKLNIGSENLDSEAIAIAALADEIWHEHYTPIIGEAQVNYMLAKFQSAGRILEDIISDNYTYYTAKCAKSGKLAAYSACQPKGEYVLLSKLYVHKDYRRNGIARHLLGEAAALCRDTCNLDIIRLTVNKYNDGSIAMYKKVGFTIIDSVKSDIGGGFYMDDYIMEAPAELLAL